jgi:hypothetical protein
MRTLCAGVATLAVGLATCLSISAQVENRNQNRNPNDRGQSNQGEIKVIRGVIGAITVEGETAIDLRTNRAVAVEASYVTIVGSEVGQGWQRDRDEADRRNDQNDRNAREAGDRQASSDRHRHNVYMLWMSPRTEIRNASAGRSDREGQNNDQKNQNANANASGNASAVSFEALEIGDRVEVRFNARNTGSETRSSMNRRHGRHRTYFGDALSITILAEPDRNDRDRDVNRDRDRNKQDSDRNKQDSDQIKQDSDRNK